MRKTVVIDYLPESVARYRSNHVIVAIDVVRATTTAITVVESGHRCFPVPTIAAAMRAAQELNNSILAGEQGGAVPPGFHLNNSPTELLRVTEISRPVVLLSSSGTRLLHAASKCQAVFLACFRNYLSVARHIAALDFPHIAVIGAGSRGEFRAEDQMCCAWVAECLTAAGYRPANRETLTTIDQWSNKPIDSWIDGKSAAYLRNSGQLADLDFILEHVGDLAAPFSLIRGEVIKGDGARDIVAAEARKGLDDV